MSAVVVMPDAQSHLEAHAHELGFESMDDYFTWSGLDWKRRATLALRATEDAREFRDRLAEVPDGFRGLLGRIVTGCVLRLMGARRRGLRVPLSVAVGHVDSPSVGDSAAATADVGEPIVGASSGAASFGAPDDNPSSGRVS